VSTRGGDPEVFDRVVLATHADQSLGMLADPSPAEQEILGAIPYQTNDIVLHTDTHLLPRTRRAWASWNYHLSGADQPSVTLTYNLNRLQGHQPDKTILETLNPTIPVDPATVLESTTYHHPIYSEQAIQAQRRFSEINGQRGTYYCGAYWGYGFHEDGVRSALAVADCFGKSLESCIAASTKAESNIGGSVRGNTDSDTD
jgi:predicted NAD/FAD-binding protein